MVSDLCDYITGVLFCWDRDNRRQNTFLGKCCLSFRQVEFRFQWEVKVFIFSRQLNIHVWSSKEDRGVKNGFESHPSNTILKIKGEDNILSFCLQSSFLPERILYTGVGQRENMRWRLRRRCQTFRRRPINVWCQNSQGRKYLRLLKVWVGQAYPSSSSILFFISDFSVLFSSSWITFNLLLLFNFWCSFFLL